MPVHTEITPKSTADTQLALPHAADLGIEISMPKNQLILEPTFTPTDIPDHRLAKADLSIQQWLKKALSLPMKPIHRNDEGWNWCTASFEFFIGTLYIHQSDPNVLGFVHIYQRYGDALPFSYSAQILWESPRSKYAYEKTYDYQHNESIGVFRQETQNGVMRVNQITYGKNSRAGIFDVETGSMHPYKGEFGGYIGWHPFYASFDAMTKKIQGKMDSNLLWHL
jgi:hypothetical protein